MEYEWFSSKQKLDFTHTQNWNVTDLVQYRFESALQSSLKYFNLVIVYPSVSEYKNNKVDI